MTVTVVGQRGDGPAMKRTVTSYEFYWAWGPYAKWLLENAQEQTVTVRGLAGTYRIRVAVHP